MESKCSKRNYYLLLVTWQYGYPSVPFSFVSTVINSWAASDFWSNKTSSYWHSHCLFSNFYALTSLTFVYRYSWSYPLWTPLDKPSLIFFPWIIFCFSSLTSPQELITAQQMEYHPNQTCVLNNFTVWTSRRYCLFFFLWLLFVLFFFFFLRKTLKSGMRTSIRCS